MLERLQLKTIIYLADQDYASENVAWCASHRVNVHQFRVKHVREPLLENSPEAIEGALRIVGGVCPLSTSSHELFTAASTRVWIIC
jgi:hypothetical protein